jgi:low temperature requirement protein LtrA
MSRTTGRERNRLARDSYSYLHFPMVVGIVLCALAFEEAVPDGGEAFEPVPAVAYCSLWCRLPCRSARCGRSPS